MRKKTNQFIISCLIFVLTCLFFSVAIKPFSLINFIGPATAIVSGFSIVWGSITIISCLVGIIIFAGILILGDFSQINISTLVLAYLAIVLQSFWAKQLIYKYIKNQQWLNSRKILLRMLVKVGPLASVVAGIAAVLITFIHTESFNISVFYVFFAGWASSLLVCVFFIPSLLLIVGKQQLSLSKRFFIITASILGGIAIALLFKVFQQQNQQFRS